MISKLLVVVEAMFCSLLTSFSFNGSATFGTVLSEETAGNPTSRLSGSPGIISMAGMNGSFSTGASAATPGTNEVSFPTDPPEGKWMKYGNSSGVSIRLGDSALDL